MSDAYSTDPEPDSEEVQQPEFRGCTVCYSAEWALYAGRKAYAKISG